jgi:hypothetical protein
MAGLLAEVGWILGRSAAITTVWQFGSQTHRATASVRACRRQMQRSPNRSERAGGRPSQPEFRSGAEAPLLQSVDKHAAAHLLIKTRCFANGCFCMLSANEDLVVRAFFASNGPIPRSKTRICSATVAGSRRRHPRYWIHTFALRGHSHAARLAGLTVGHGHSPALTTHNTNSTQVDGSEKVAH